MHMHIVLFDAQGVCKKVMPFPVFAITNQKSLFFLAVTIWAGTGQEASAKDNLFRPCPTTRREDQKSIFNRTQTIWKKRLLLTRT